MYLDLRKEERKTYEIVLPNSKKIQLMSPSKGLSDTFPYVGEAIIAIEQNNNKDDINKHVDFLYETAARLISRNIAGVEYTKKEIEEIFSYAQLIRFYEGYAEFIREIVNQKN